MPLIRIANLTYAYAPTASTSVPALQGIDLQIEAGQYVALIGANGSGKTTLARHLNALLMPTAGDVWIDGLNTRDRSVVRAIRSLVGMVFQSPADQLVATVVEEDVAFGPENLGIAEDELPQRVRRALEQVGMWPLRHRPPHMLSAGQQQRVAIAGVLAMAPRCLVLDEATAMLDPAGRGDVLRVIDALHRDGMTIVAITSPREATKPARLSRLTTLGLRAAARAMSVSPMPTYITCCLRKWKASPGRLLAPARLALG